MAYPPKTDIERAATHFGVPVSEVTVEMVQHVRGIPRGSGLEPMLETTVEDEEAPDTYAMLMHFGIKELGSPGAVLDEARAVGSSCKCFGYDDKDYCFSKGVIGLLTQDQEKKYCALGKNYTVAPGIKKHFAEFSEAAKEAHKKIEDMKPGMERLETWLEAMGAELGKRGIEV